MLLQAAVKAGILHRIVTFYWLCVIIT